MSKHIDIVFDGPPGPEAGRFVEVENAEGWSINFGEWVKRSDGYWALRIPSLEAAAQIADAVVEENTLSGPYATMDDSPENEAARNAARGIAAAIRALASDGKASVQEASAEPKA